MEPVARDAYMAESSRQGAVVTEHGLFVDPELPFLGASTDGFIQSGGDKGVLEIKCRYLPVSGKISA